eukprot:7016809-Heterocapsa_arctica.AAC.1
MGGDGSPGHGLIFPDRVPQAMADQEEVEFFWLPVVRVTRVGSFSAPWQEPGSPGGNSLSPELARLDVPIPSDNPRRPSQ